ncbi:MAG TPA: LytTR family DNA-binding domain-containing protein [Thermoanaerobaculia bacterium]|nr:LytTR family DNA-binding domain-containing protein [Thermoanaerobaculia bacterium]
MPETIRTLIVDDEPLAREGVRLHLAGEPDIEVVGECGDGEAAVEAIRDLAPDLLFLDIQLPGLDGFEVLDRVPERVPAVVFVTAYDRHAVAAFERHALDYLLKPYDAPRFARALARVRDELARRDREAVGREVLEVLRELRGRPGYLQRVAVRTAGRYVFLRLDEIDWIEAAENYVRLHAGGRGHLLRETMAGLEGRLDPERFLRVHRSAIVRVDAIQALERLSNNEFAVVLADGTRLVSSRGYRERIEDLLRRSR